MEQHGVRAYLSLVGTGVLVLLHVWPMDAVDDGVYWVGSDSSTVGLSGPAGPEFFRRSGLLLPSLFLSLAEETVDPSWTPFLLAVKISDRRCFWESPTSPPSSDMDAASFIISSTWLGVHGQVGVQGQVGGLDFPVRGIFPVQLGPFMTLVSSVDFDR